MVKIKARPTPTSTGKIRITQQGLVGFLLGTSLTAIILVGKLLHLSTTDDHHNNIRVNDASNVINHDAPIKDEHTNTQTLILPIDNVEAKDAAVSRTNRLLQLKKKYQSYPGFTGEASVVCGAHKAPTCEECPQGNGAGWCNGECEWIDGGCTRSSKLALLHPDYFRITERYAFQPVMTNNKEYVNVIAVRSPFRGRDDEALYRFYQDEILFIGISSFEAFPLPPTNPYSQKFNKDYYIGMFPGFLHNMHKPEEHFPPTVKTMLMSQSDFMLDEPEIFGKEHANVEKIYDFVYSGGVSCVKYVMCVHVIFDLMYISQPNFYV